MKRDIFNNVWVIRVASLLFAIVLFIYVQTEINISLSYLQGRESTSVESTETISNLPVVLGNHSENVFITGLPEKVEVRLTGPKNIISQITPENFQVKTEDIEEKDLGNHALRLVVRDLPEEVSYQVTPSQVVVNVAAKETKKFPIEYDLSPTAVAEDFEVESVTLNPTEVTLTGSAETMEKVDRVMINITSNEMRTESFEQTYRLQILGSDGQLLGLNADVIDIQANVKVKPLSKELKLQIKPEKENSKQYDYQYELLEDSVTVTGTRAALEQMEEFPVNIDVSKLEKTKEVEVTLRLPDGVEKVEPQKIKVKVQVNKK